MLAGFSSGSLPLATTSALKPLARTLAGVPEAALGAGTPVVIWATAAAAAASPAPPTATPGTILRNVCSLVEGWRSVGKVRRSSNPPGDTLVTKNFSSCDSPCADARLRRREARCLAGVDRRAARRVHRHAVGSR